MNAQAVASTRTSTSNQIDGKALYLAAATAALSALIIFIPQTPNPEQIDRIAAETVTAIHQMRDNKNPEVVVRHSDSEYPTQIRLAFDDTHGKVTARITNPGLCQRLVRSVFTTPTPGAMSSFSAVLLNHQRLTPAQAIQTAPVHANCIMAGYGEEAIEVQLHYPTNP